ncbi:hypothetical protein ACJ73_07813, partial [Blastomyces percursus]
MKDLCIQIPQQPKQGYWNGQIAEATQGKDIFKMINWSRSTGSFHSPPLKDEAAGVVRTVPGEKRELLQQVLLQKAASKEDISVDWADDVVVRLPFPEATAYEIQSSLLNTGNTTPGTDGVPAAVLKKAWRHIQTP